MNKYMVSTDVDLKEYFDTMSTNVRSYLDAKTTKDIICIYGDHNDCELWDHSLNGNFTLTSTIPEAETETFSVGWVGFGVLNLNGTDVLCVSVQNASPLGFFIHKKYLELIDQIKDEDDLDPEFVFAEVQNLRGAAMDWAVEYAIGSTSQRTWFKNNVDHTGCNYSTGWEYCGPLIERFGVSLVLSWKLDGSDQENSPSDWIAAIKPETTGMKHYTHAFETPLIAVCVAVIHYLVGSHMEIPKDLLQ